MIVVQHRTDRRHQADGPFLAIEQDSRRDLGRRERKRGSDETRRDSLLTTPVGLMTRLTDVAVDLPPGVESRLFFGCQRRQWRGEAWLAGPFDPRQDVGGARAEIATRRGNR